MKLTSPFFSSGARARTAIRIPTALGSRIFAQRMIRSWPLPGSAQRFLVRCSLAVVSAVMSKNVLLGPTGDVEQGTGWKEIEAGLCKSGTVFPRKALVELLFQLM